MTEEVYSFSPGLLKLASLLGALGILLFVGVLAEAVRVELEWLELVVADFRALLGLWALLELASY